MALSDHAIFFTKGTKLVLNIVILVLYRNGDEGYFMGATHNMNHDTESFATGVFIGFMIYNCVTIIALFFNREQNNITESLMNLLGALLWLTAGGVIIQYWIRYDPSNHFSKHGNPKPAGIAMGALGVVNAIVYLGETFLTYRAYSKYVNYEK